jgi:hypothetical protein
MHDLIISRHDVRCGPDYEPAVTHIAPGEVLGDVLAH